MLKVSKFKYTILERRCLQGTTGQLVVLNGFRVESLQKKLPLQVDEKSVNMSIQAKHS